MRKPRQYSKTGFYHTYARGNNKQNIFYDDNDRKYFLFLLKKFSKKFNIRIHSYTLMENHFHLQIEDIEENISIFMGTLCSVYARYFNKKYDRIGHLFQARFGSEIINSKTNFIECFRYILQNPEIAGICETNKYEWSSYKLYKDSNSFIFRHLLLEFFNTYEAIEQYLKTITKKRFIDLELRPSEFREFQINKIMKILNRNTPIIPPEWPKEKIMASIRKLRKAGFSIRSIARITGVSRKLAEQS